MIRRPVPLLALALAASFPAIVVAQAEAQPAKVVPGRVAVDPNLAGDVKALEAAIVAFTAAFNANDPTAVAATFTTDARIADEAGSIRGRDAIRARFDAYFKENPKAKIAIRSEEVIFVSPDVAIEEGRAIVSPAETGSRPETTRYSAVYVRQGGAWLQSSLREFAAEEPNVPERLKDLEWLVGDWVNESPHAVVTTSCKWSDDKHFLLRDFTIHVEGKPALRGNERIGWDPVAKQIRSWVFDSEGGFGEGYWSRAGETWMIKASGVRKDGKTATATQVITRAGRDHLRWAAFDRTSGSELAPDAHEFALVRRPPQPGGTR